MHRPDTDRNRIWTIIAADERRPEWVPDSALELKSVPVQYCRLGGSLSLFQRSLNRATSLVPASRVLITALQEHRERWDPHAWFVRPTLRFVCDEDTAAQAASAAAILSIAERSLSNIIIVLPARSYVAHEGVLRDALEQVVAKLPDVPEGVATLGMVDIDEAVDEDYLLLCRKAGGAGLGVNGIVRRPTSWVARHLRRQGAVVASGILVGYAGVFAAHLSKCWPGVTARLLSLYRSSTATQSECRLSKAVTQTVPGPVMRGLRWDAPVFPQRVFRVGQCGWSGLKSPHEVARIADFLSYSGVIDGSGLSQVTEIGESRPIGQAP
jgi:mannose-1-phosphate guanylyltransferase